MFKLPELPYGYDALQPVVSEITMRTHHDKHHKAYVDVANTLVAEKGLSGKTMEDLVKYAKATPGEQKLFNQSGQAWNHAFFWESMAPSPAKPQGAFADAVKAAFGDLEQLKAKFVAEGVGHFASGWVWLVAEGGALKVISTHDADTALVHDAAPILVCDLWEHAYYLDYKNLRKDFLEKWFDGVANWGFAAKQFDAALGKGEGYRYPAPADQA
jgi:Fe-Mn family superoxide dismutase